MNPNCREATVQCLFDVCGGILFWYFTCQFNWVKTRWQMFLSQGMWPARVSNLKLVFWHTHGLRKWEWWLSVEVISVNIASTYSFLHEIADSGRVCIPACPYLIEKFQIDLVMCEDFWNHVEDVVHHSLIYTRHCLQGIHVPLKYTETQVHKSVFNAFHIPQLVAFLQKPLVTLMPIILWA